MFKIQKYLNLINGEQYGNICLKSSNVRPNQILDRCVIDSFVKDSMIDSEVIQECINDISRITNTCHDSNSSLYSSSASKISTINKLLEVDKDTNDVFIENFENCKNIDMSSNVFINFANNYCCLEYEHSRQVGISSIEISNDFDSTLKKMGSVKNSFSDDAYHYTVLNSTNEVVNILLDITLKEMSSMNELRLICSSVNSCDFSLYAYTEGQYINIANTSTCGNPFFIFNEITTDKLRINITKKYDYLNGKSYNHFIIFNSISALANIYSTTSSLSSKPFKLYGNTASITTTIDCSNKDDISCYVGIIDKGDDITWFNGETLIDAGISIESTNVLNKSQSAFCTYNDKGACSVFKLNNNVNTNSIKLYAGYNKYKVLVIGNSIVDDDLTYLQYTNENIISRHYENAQGFNVSISSGNLIIASSEFFTEEERYIVIPFLQYLSDENGLRTSVRVNGKNLNNSAKDNGYGFHCKKGQNTIDIILYLKGDAFSNKTYINVKVPINLTAFSDFIYTKELSQVQYLELLSQKSDTTFAIGSGNVYLNTNVDKQIDQFLIKYTYVSDSNKLYNDFNGSYIKCIYKLKLNAKNKRKNVFVKSIQIQSK